MRHASAFTWSSMVLGVALTLGTSTFAQQGGSSSSAPASTTPTPTTPGTAAPNTPTTTPANPNAKSPIVMCGLTGTGTGAATGTTGTGTMGTGTMGTGTSSTGTTGMGTTGTGTTGTGTTGTSTSTTVTPVRLSSTDTCFVEQAALTNLFEIQSSQLAAGQASNAQVKSFAQRLIQDHTTANQQLRTATTRLGATVPTTLTGPKAQMLASLRSQRASAFDRAFINAQVMGHEQAVNLFRDYSQSGGQPDLRAYAARTLPALREHLQMAKDLQTALSK